MKPQDFFIGVRDFFAIFFPGLLLIAMFPAQAKAFSTQLTLTFGTSGGAVLLIVVALSAYGFGLVLSGLAAKLDDLADWALRVRRSACQRSGKVPRWKCSRAERKLADLEKHATEFACRMVFGPPPAKADSPVLKSTKGFWWTYMRLKCPVATAQLDLLEGQQKLFRSLIVLAAIAPLALWLSAGAASWQVLLASLVTFAASAFLYASYRIRFGIRLYELALVYGIPEERIKEAGKGFFRVSAPASPPEQVAPRGPDEGG